MCVCMYACMYVCMYVRVYVCMYVRVWMYIMNFTIFSEVHFHPVVTVSTRQYKSSVHVRILLVTIV